MKKYKLIYADPPWKYGKSATPTGARTIASETQYDTMSVTELKELPIKDLADDDCALFCWMTVPLLPETLPLLSHWGFKYKTCIFWHKHGKCKGLGYWYLGNVEILTVSIKGDIKPFKSKRENIIKAPRGAHSEKPRIFYKILEETRLEPRIELFARNRLEGWDSWGNERGSTIQKRLSSFTG